MYIITFKYRRLPFYGPNPTESSLSLPNEQTVQAYSSKVGLGSPKRYLNTLSIVSTPPSSSSSTSSDATPPPPPAVLLHGYGAGLGFFFLNFPALAAWAGRRRSAVYAVDWLGMGRSARVPFNVKSKREDVKGRVTEAEGFFVDSLEEWRDKMGLEKMTLVGHSLGAYFSVVYALKYPHRVNKLILLSPAGVPHDPNGTTEPSRELTDEGGPGVDGPEGGQAELASGSDVNGMRKGQADRRREESRARKLFTYLWEEGWSPFQVVRSSLFWGPMLVGKVSRLEKRVYGLFSIYVHSIPLDASLG
jgi:cardiolipin-specific phospholipase